VTGGARLRRSVSTLVLAGVMAGAGTVNSQAVTPPDQGVWYEIFVRSFQDSDGDGVGDLNGVTSRLPYLAELGVTGLWLMPIHPSPSYHGYDVADYRGVNPEYGTLEDFRVLLDEAHALNIRVIIDFIPNHSASLHPWFMAAASGDPTYRDYYVWSDDPPAWRGTRGGNAWHVGPDGSSYLGLFSGGMPDLNFRNPAVRREFEEIARYWLDFGVDGFRIDAIQHIVESEAGAISNTPETYQWVSEFQSFVRRIAPDALLVGETWTEMPAIVRYHVDAGLAMSFDYPLWRELLSALQARSAADLAFTVAQAETLYPATAWRGTFIGNHDQTRVATLFSLPRRDERRLKLAASLLLTLPGTPFIYYGEEIGMADGPGGGDLAKRLPMRWDAGDDFGFSDVPTWAEPGAAIGGLSVEEQRLDPASLWWHYRRMISVRRIHPALYSGSTTVIDVGDRSLLAMLREAGGERLLVLANVAARDGDVDLTTVAGVDADGAVDIITGAAVGAESDLVVPALSLRILRLP
jgi:glycosidase